MFGMGMPEILLILAIALIVIGPKKLPELAKSMGRAMNEFKRATSELKDTMELDYDAKHIKKTFSDINNKINKPIDVEPVDEDENKVESSKSDVKNPKQSSSDEKNSVHDDNNDDDDDLPGTDIPAELMADDDDEPERVNQKPDSEKTDTSQGKTDTK